MRLSLLFLTLIFCSLSADDNTPTVGLKIKTFCGASRIGDLFKYEEYRLSSSFAIKDQNNLEGILPYGNNPNENQNENILNSFYFGTPSLLTDNYHEKGSNKSVNTSTFAHRFQ